MPTSCTGDASWPGRQGGTAPSAQFVPIAVSSVLAERAGTQGVDIKLRRSGITVKLSWTASEMDLAAWLRELLR